MRYAMSLPLRGAWIEIPLNTLLQPAGKSLPLRGAWIEITLGRMFFPALEVAPLAGGVD